MDRSTSRPSPEPSNSEPVGTSRLMPQEATREDYMAARGPDAADWWVTGHQAVGGLDDLYVSPKAASIGRMCAEFGSRVTLIDPGDPHHHGTADVAPVAARCCRQLSSMRRRTGSRARRNSTSRRRPTTPRRLVRPKRSTDTKERAARRLRRQPVRPPRLCTTFVARTGSAGSVRSGVVRVACPDMSTTRPRRLLAGGQR